MFDSVKFEELYLVSSRNGLTRPSKVRGAGTKMINMGELFAYSRIMNPNMELVQVNEKELKNFGVLKGDLLFARQSLVAEGAGKCSIVIDAPEPTVFESHLIRIRLDQTKADPNYYFYFFTSKIGNGIVQGMVMEVAASGIRGSDLAKIKVLYPPLPTQQRIASLLSAYDDLIEVNNQRIKLLEQTARELYKEWFVRFRFPGYKQAKFKKGVPEGWITEKFDKHIKIVRGKSYTSQEIDDNIGEYPFINLKNMNRSGGFRLDGTKYFTGKFKKEQIVTPGDIVMAVTDMTQDRLIVGRVARVPLTEHKEYVISLDIAKIIPLELPTEFLYSILRFNYYGESLAELANGTNVLHLSPDLLKKYSLLIPPQTLTYSFSEKVIPIYDLMDVLAIQSNHCRQIRDRLLPRLISGKLEVKEATNKKAVME